MISKFEFITQLNGDIEREYAAAIQYMQHAATIGGLYSFAIGHLLEHANEEIAHAKLLNDHVAYLKGRPSSSVAPVFTASDSRAMLVQDLTGENEAIVKYKERIVQARELGLEGTIAILHSILKDEEHHANDLETFLQ